MNPRSAFDDLRQDVRYALRSFARNPGFTAVAVLTLALGIDANTSIFTVVNFVLLRPLPYEDSERLVRLTETVPASETPDGRPRRSGNITVAELLELRSRSRTLSHVSFSGGPAMVTLSGRGEATRLQGMQVEPGIFETLGAAPLLGGGLGATEQAPGGDAEVVLSYTAWQRYFAADPLVLGETATFANSLAPNPEAASKKYVVVGVMPEGFEFADAQIQFWISVGRASHSQLRETVEH